jgi:ferredoxin
MNMESMKLVYFSPTGTTKAVLQAIGDGFSPGVVECIDITTPDARREPLRTSANELLVIGVPVYMGRVPALLSEWLNTMQARDTPAVCVVVYGNRAYENALLELKDIVTSRGGIPIAGAAYIAEHSFSTAETPASQGRPNAEDQRHASAFGHRIREKLESMSGVSQAGVVEVPGERPYAGITELWDVDFIEVDDGCNQCGSCAAGCPVGAIDPEDSARIDHVKCITCCACLKSCPENARTRKPGPVEDAAHRLMSLYAEPKKPECFM